MNDSRKQELAFLYVMDALETDNKPAVFQLLLEDAQFRQYVKEEVELRDRLRYIRVKLDPAVQTRLYERIQHQMKNGATGDFKIEQPSRIHWDEYALRLTLPPLVVPIVKTLQRRCVL